MIKKFRHEFIRSRNFCYLSVIIFLIFLPTPAISQSVREFRPPVVIEPEVPQLSAAAEQGDTAAMYRLGFHYYWDSDPAKKAKGETLIMQSATLGNAEAQFYLSLLTAQNPEISTAWLERSVKQDFPFAYSHLALKYLTGEGVKPDSERARSLLLRGAELGDVQAISLLGSVYFNGDGVPRDQKKAARWYMKAASAGYTTAQYHLGVMYSLAQGVKRDFSECYFWLSMAGKYGMKDSVKRAADCGNRLDRAERAQVDNRVASWRPVTEISDQSDP